MRKAILTGSALILMVPSVAAATSTEGVAPVTLKPSSPWAADFAEDSCALRRQFGSGNDAVLLEIAQYQPGRAMVITIAGKSLETTREVAQYRFLPALQNSDPGHSSLVRFGDGYEGVFFNARLEATTTTAREAVDGEKVPPISLPDGLPMGTKAKPALVQLENRKNAISEENHRKRAEEITALRIEGAFTSPLTLATGPMAEPMRVMDNCLKDLMLTWNLKPTADGSMPKMATLLNGEKLAKLTSEYYPRDALRNEISDTLHLRVMVDADGSPTSCQAQTPSRMRSLEKAACKPFMRHGRFSPALDTKGRAVASYYTTTVSFSIN